LNIIWPVFTVNFFLLFFFIVYFLSICRSAALKWHLSTWPRTNAIYRRTLLIKQTRLKGCHTVDCLSGKYLCTRTNHEVKHGDICVLLNWNSFSRPASDDFLLTVQWWRVTYWKAAVVHEYSLILSTRCGEDFI